MTDHSEQTPIQEFKEKVAEVLELLNQNNIPIVVADNGRPEAVLPDAASHMQAREAVEHSQTLEEIRKGLARAEGERTQHLADAIHSIFDGRSQR